MSNITSLTAATMAHRAIHELTEGLLRLFFPPQCELCHKGIEEGDLCADCETGILAGSGIAYCPRCGMGVGPHASDGQGCGRCRGMQLAFDGVIRIGPYEGLLADACLRIKSLEGIRLSAALGKRLMELRRSELFALDADGVVAIPLHWQRRWSRRYNQVEPLAAVLSRSLHLPLARGLKRWRNTPAQHRMTASNRRTNMRAAFAVGKSGRWTGKHWLLVDDVVTTGSTCAGAARVTIVCLARGEGHLQARRKAENPAAAAGTNAGRGAGEGATPNDA